MQRVAILDTDPGHVKDEGSVGVDATGLSDFVSSLGHHEELLRFRDW
jgi:hypothetical protein